jgi:hypothetical protein
MPGPQSGDFNKLSTVDAPKTREAAPFLFFTQISHEYLFYPIEGSNPLHLQAQALR